ncbi:MAG: hypothetical protein HQM09_05535 [Candidatus Riflebacteria bacterium]|nr:hypothetical protein [Candidatus Riflebacteria bacterium]
MARKGVKSGCLGALIKWAFPGIFLVAVIGGVVWSQRNVLLRFSANMIAVKPGKVHFDLGGLLLKRCRGFLTLDIGNRLPVGILLKEMNYIVEVNGIRVGDGSLVTGKSIAALATTSVDLSFAVDSVAFPAALAKTAPDFVLETAGAVLERLKGKRTATSASSTNRGNLLRLTGKADFRLFSGAIEFPLDQSTNFQKNW